MRLTWRTSDGLLRLRPDHEARRVAERDDRQAERVAQLHEARRLVGAGPVDRARQVHRVVGDQPERWPSMRISAVIMPGANSGRSSSTQPVSASALDHLADVVDAQPVLRDEVAQHPSGPRRSHCATRPWKYDRYFFAAVDGFALVGDRDVDDAVGHLHRHRADLVGRVDAEPAAFDHRRAAHADVRVRRRDDHVAAAEQRRVAGEAASRIDADARHQCRRAWRIAGTSAYRARRRRGNRCRPAGRRRLRRSTMIGKLPFLRDLEQAILLADGSSRPACRRARCSRRPSRRSAPCSSPNCAAFTVPMPVMMPSPGVFLIRSSSVRRRRCAAKASAPYSMKLPGSHEIGRRSRAPCAGWSCAAARRRRAGSRRS